MQAVASPLTRFHFWGRRPVQHDPRTLQFSRYATAVPIAPGICDWAAPIRRWPLLGNGTIGDCTLCTCAHLVQAWTRNEIGRGVLIPQRRVVRAYSAVSGYRPGHPRTDAGADMLTVNRYWRKTGIGGHKVKAFAAVNWQHVAELYQAIWLLGGVAIGLALPDGLVNSVALADPTSVWDVPAGGAVGEWLPNENNGHAVCLLGYNAATGLYQFASWTATYTMSAAFLAAYCEEAYCYLSPGDWVRTGYAPNGFDTAALLADLQQLAAA